MSSCCRLCEQFVCCRFSLWIRNKSFLYCSSLQKALLYRWFAVWLKRNVSHSETTPRFDPSPGENWHKGRLFPPGQQRAIITSLMLSLSQLRGGSFRFGFKVELCWSNKDKYLLTKQTQQIVCIWVSGFADKHEINTYLHTVSLNDITDWGFTFILIEPLALWTHQSVFAQCDNYKPKERLLKVSVDTQSATKEQ